MPPQDSDFLRATAETRILAWLVPRVGAKNSFSELSLPSSLLQVTRTAFGEVDELLLTAVKVAASSSQNPISTSSRDTVTFSPAAKFLAAHSMDASMAASRSGNALAPEIAALSAAFCN